VTNADVSTTKYMISKPDNKTNKPTTTSKGREIKLNWIILKLIMSADAKDCTFSIPGTNSRIFGTMEMTTNAIIKAISKRNIR